MRVKFKEKAVFIFQVTEVALKVAKFLLKNNKRELAALEFESVSADIEDTKLIEKLKYIFNKLGFSNHQIIVSLPRNNVTCRYLKVPSHIPQEIERIVNLQAVQYLPYSASELITAYEVVSIDEEGYSYINLIVAHRNVIDRYLGILEGLNAQKLTIALSSYGICDFYNYIQPRDEIDPVMVIDIDACQAELAIILNKKLLFSRSFRFVRSDSNLEAIFIDEINKTKDAYAKEVLVQGLNKMVIFENGDFTHSLVAKINKTLKVPVDAIHCFDKIVLPENLSKDIFNSDNSASSIMGLGLMGIQESLNILPLEVKEKIKRIYQYKEYLKLIFFSSVIILVFALGVARSIKNKAVYLERMKLELANIAKEAKPLEEIDKRLRFIENNSGEKSSSLEILSELHKFMPEQMHLNSFIYEEENHIVLRGQALELNSIFIFVSQIEESEVFKRFNIKVRRATKKETPQGEIVDFEIECLKR